MFFLRSGITFVRFLMLLMAGIAIGLSTRIKVPIAIFFIAITLYCFLSYVEKRYLRGEVMKSMVAWVVLFLCGVLLVEVKTEKNASEHFIHLNDSITSYRARVCNAPEYTEKSMKILLEVSAVRIQDLYWRRSFGKTIGYIRKDSTLKIEKGDVLLIKGKPSQPPAPSNPGQFDYSDYLSRQNIYAIHFLATDHFRKVGHEEEYWLIRLSNDFRSFCESKIRAGIKGDNEYYLTVALLLGVKAGLDEKLYQAYSETGTVHALAVSGLHVSLIYFIVIFMFGFLKRIKYGKFLFALLSILVFWFYALVTGFSPSVVRAVTMFSVFLIAGVLKKNSGIYNTLAFSAFIILCIEPFWLMDIGFQFSFLAVVGIAYLYPLIYGWLELKNYVGDKLWSLVCLSIVAQLAVSPLSVYYFHSFPLLFLPFNMLIVPLSSLALYTGLAGLMVYKISFLFEWCMLVTEYIVWLMNFIVQIPSGSEYLKVDFLSFTKIELILIYLSILFFFFSVKNKGYKIFIYASFFSMLFSCSVLYNTILNFHREIFTVYNVKGKTVVSLINRGSTIVLSDNVLAKNDKDFRFNLYNHLANERITDVKFGSFGDTSLVTQKNYPFGQLIVWKGIRIMRICKNPEMELSRTLMSNIDYLIISNDEFYKKMLRSKDGRGAKTIILDTSLKGKISMQGENFYSISKRGAFVARVEER